MKQYKLIDTLTGAFVKTVGGLSDLIIEAKNKTEAEDKKRQIAGDRFKVVYLPQIK